MPGPRTLRGQLVLAFLVLTLVPAVTLTAITTARLLRAVERWEQPGVQRALTGSLDVARDLTHRMENDLRQRGQLLAADVAMEARDPDPLAVADLLATAYNLDFVQIYDLDGTLRFETTRSPLVASPGSFEDVHDRAVSDDPFLRDTRDTDLLAHTGLLGDPGSETGVLVVGLYLDRDFYTRLEDLSQAVAYYRQLRYLIEINQRGVLITLGITLLALAGLAVWIALRLGRRMADPISDLGKGMERVTAGEAEVRVTPRGSAEIERLIGTFNVMSRELAQSRVALAQAERQAAWREAARRVAHEMKNALTPMTFSLHRIRKLETDLPADQKDRLDRSVATILEEVEGLNRLAASFSELARLPVPEMKPLDLASVVTGVVEGAAEPGLTLHWDPPAKPVRVLGDAALLRQAITNLVRNASEALVDRKGTIWLHLSGATGTATLVVEDDGPGWPEGKAVLEPYVTTKATGTGLGLSLVQRTLFQHGGSLVLEDRPGGGARAVITLPLA